MISQLSAVFLTIHKNCQMLTLCCLLGPCSLCMGEMVRLCNAKSCVGVSGMKFAG